MTPLVDAARAAGFARSCRDEHGELLRVLARGVGDGVIGETGTGAGVGLAWLTAGAAPGARLVSIERDPARAAAAARLFRDEPRVEVVTGDWRSLRPYGPFDLLVLDGGGQGKGSEPPLDPAEWLRPGGLVVMDDFTPCTSWPPTYEGRVDEARQWWLTHPDLRATQVNVTPDAATLLATYLPGATAPR
ncbi:class I SAM-dependent methyltransferase [Dactylosporangium sp. NPDC000244]|uniref:O-methyltransferase n=1 Tax=Dactylosporangium sp. NPDC000244 TaxID=3154365 RepID=UPI00331B5B99